MNEAELSLPLLRWSVCLCIWSLKELRIHFVSYSLSPSYLSLSSLSHLSLFPVEHSGRNQSRELFCIIYNCTFTSNLGHNILSKWMFFLCVCFFFLRNRMLWLCVCVFLCEFVIHSTCVCGWFGLGVCITMGAIHTLFVTEGFGVISELWVLITCPSVDGPHFC